MQITTVGLDLAKNVFQVHGVSEHGKVLLRKQLRRDQVAAFFANMPPCLIGMEACGGAHHWARKLQAMGHTVRLMAPQFVKPYVKSNKNDAADAEAICEAVGRPSMRFVPIKNIEQQSVLALHRVREAFVKARTAQANQIRGLLGEYRLSDWHHKLSPFWLDKIEGNRRRDRRNSAALRKAGWKVVRVWEHDVMKRVERAASRVERHLLQGETNLVTAGSAPKVS